MKVLDAEKYEHELQEFDMLVQKLYEYGSKCFLTKNICGDQETFYMHCLRFYLPRIAKDTWSKHKLGIGVFTMQGYERRNKESKNTLRRFSNRRGNIVVPNMKRLWDVFAHGQTAV